MKPRFSKLAAILLTAQAWESDFPKREAQGLTSSHAKQDKTLQQIKLEQGFIPQRSEQTETLATTVESEQQMITDKAEKPR